MKHHFFVTKLAYKYTDIDKPSVLQVGLLKQLVPKATRWIDGCTIGEEQVGEHAVVVGTCYRDC